MSPSVDTPVQPILSLQGVSCEFNGFWALKDLNFELHAHEAPMVAGKPRCSNSCTGSLHPNEGI